MVSDQLINQSAAPTLDIAPASGNLGRDDADGCHCAIPLNYSHRRRVCMARRAHRSDSRAWQRLARDRLWAGVHDLSSAARTFVRRERSAVPRLRAVHGPVCIRRGRGVGGVVWRSPATAKLAEAPGTCRGSHRAHYPRGMAGSLIAIECDSCGRGLVAWCCCRLDVHPRASSRRRLRPERPFRRSSGSS